MIVFRIKQTLRRIIPYSLILALHKARAIFAFYRYGNPARGLHIIAVAGTKGKTTTSNMIARILEGSGHKVAMLSTANFQLGDKKWLNDVKLTTPTPGYVQKFLRQAADAGCDYAILETSSHGMVQHRYWGIRFESVVITNLGSDHLDYHKTFENYKRAHYGLIGPGLKALIVNYDDEDTRELLRLPGVFERQAFTLKDYAKLDTYTLAQVSRIALNEAGSSFTLRVAEEECAVELPLMGEFNIYNALGALLAARTAGVPLAAGAAQLALLADIPGRLEKIEEGQDFEVIVDYAHSPESLEKVYGVLRPHAKGRLIAVLGGTGDRDKSYRTKGGALADRFADIVIVTNEDPYSEQVEDIIDQVMSGITGKEPGRTLFRISDRREAIRKAFALAQAGDLVAITGKGCEQFMIFGDKKVPWDDRAVARELLRARQH